MIACAHRGLSAEYAENTLAAFRAAALHGFDAIELDVRTTHDGEVVVLHDPTLERTTNGYGRVADLDYDEVRVAGTGEGPIPRLIDVWDAMQDWKGLWNVELKAAAAAVPVAEMVDDLDLQARVLVSSFDPRALAAARSTATLRTGLIVAGPPDDLDLAIAHDLGCAWMNVDHTALDPAVVARLRTAGLRVAAWTVNDEEEATRLAEVDCLITDTRAVLELVQALPRGGAAW